MNKSRLKQRLLAGKARMEAARAFEREIMAAAADKRARRALRPIPPTALVQR